MARARAPIFWCGRDGAAAREAGAGKRAEARDVEMLNDCSRRAAHLLHPPLHQVAVDEVRLASLQQALGVPAGAPAANLMSCSAHITYKASEPTDEAQVAASAAESAPAVTMRRQAPRRPCRPSRPSLPCRGTLRAAVAARFIGNNHQRGESRVAGHARLSTPLASPGGIPPIPRVRTFRRQSALQSGRGAATRGAAMVLARNKVACDAGVQQKPPAGSRFRSFVMSSSPQVNGGCHWAPNVEKCTACV